MPGFYPTAIGTRTRPFPHDPGEGGGGRPLASDAENAQKESSVAQIGKVPICLQPPCSPRVLRVKDSLADHQIDENGEMGCDKYIT